MGSDEKIVFITGDLGFNALEGIRDTMKDRFINAGVAEQNMIGVAAGLAHKGYSVFCYSIAPFITYRCLEQIRIDVCYHKLPVFIVGNGGGYGYGIMGFTHHAISDLACMSSLPGLDCYIPSFTEEVESSLTQMLSAGRPSYLRLGLGRSKPAGLKTFESINPLLLSPQPEMTVMALGPLAASALETISKAGFEKKIDLFSAVKLPFANFNDKFVQSVKASERLLILEEHVSRGGIAENIALSLMNLGIMPKQFKAIPAAGYPGELYGDQNYHQRQSGLDQASILGILQNWLMQ